MDNHPAFDIKFITVGNAASTAPIAMTTLSTSMSLL